MPLKKILIVNNSSVDQQFVRELFSNGLTSAMRQPSPAGWTFSGPSIKRKDRPATLYRRRVVGRSVQNPSSRARASTTRRSASSESRNPSRSDCRAAASTCLT